MVVLPPRSFRLADSRFGGAFRAAGGSSVLTLAHYDTEAPASYTLDTARVSGLADLSGNGRNLSNAVAADRPTIAAFVDGGDSLAFTTSAEWLHTTDPVLGALTNPAQGGWEVDIGFEVTTLGLNTAMLCWNRVGDNNPAVIIGLSTANRIRYQRRSEAAVVRTVDSVVTVTTGVAYNLTVSVEGGLLNAWLDGLQIIQDEDAIGAVPGDLACDRFSIGARNLSTPSLPTAGRVQEVRLRQI